MQVMVEYCEGAHSVVAVSEYGPHSAMGMTRIYVTATMGFV